MKPAMTAVATNGLVTILVTLLLWIATAAAECDGAAGAKCLTTDLSNCKAANKTNPCPCADASLVCLAAADCAASPTLLATAQLGFSGSSCEVPPAAAVASVGGACSITGRSRCFANLNWCAIKTRGSNPFPQPGVCTTCNANFFSCAIEYKCEGLADTRSAFDMAQRVYKCVGAEADFDAGVKAAGGTAPSAGPTTTAAPGVATTTTAGSANPATTAGSAGPATTAGSGAATTAAGSSAATTARANVDQSTSAASTLVLALAAAAAALINL